MRNCELTDLEVLELRLLRGRERRRAVLAALGVRLEVARVARALRLHRDRRRVVPREQLVPVRAVEVRVALDVRHPVLERPQPLRVVDHQQPLHKVPRARVEPVRELHLALQDLLVDPERRVVVERRVPRDEFVQQDPHRPPVHRLAVALALDHLGRQVLGRPAQRERPLRHLLREPEVRDLDVPLVVQQQVLRLQVAVDDVFGVHVLEREHQLRVVELGHVVGEPPRRAQVREHLAPDDELEHKVQLLLVLERRPHVHDERVLQLHQDPLLRDDVLHLLHLDDLALLQALHREVLVRALVLAQPHAPERARAQRLLQLEVRQLPRRRVALSLAAAAHGEGLE
mmetsp:Transcript_48062/g.148315  ORF Transcript_48062/g.148315 Transcript_48062/m.148315 type:complete len:343 (-) Transcript_48062:141-1169(-)|eukprot:CAMPEP_0174827960 /NCGR_PEP_ID=MMETSP1114-20130205/1042_1 /TAXON_ID=312471 /ORGANISM="Neobodo designis, Strain CCAP 1951/1" /LENGTH=342 /DNA_ID=CAMNT_0016061651 /DNA_START=226 /DNA_END=1254 /DNA_ORIENTATION=+